MNKLYILLAVAVLFLAGCTKRDYVIPDEIDIHEWMRSRDEGIVAYVDYFTGNYVVDTYNGFAVVTSRGGITPHEEDAVYAFFGSRGVQTIYNYNGDYFSDDRIVDTWLSWDDAMYLIDDLASDHY
jgi:hypothetical protein